MTTAPSSTSAIPIDPRIRVIAAGIAAVTPEAQVRLPISLPLLFRPDTTTAWKSVRQIDSSW